MNGIVWHGPKDLRLEEVAEPSMPEASEALVEVSYCGVCGTDLHEYLEGPMLIRRGPHPLTGESPPLVLGHEFSGRVAALGGPVEGIAVGDRVTVDPCWRCGHCYWCRRGDYHICRVGGSVGLASNGALAPLVKVPLEGLVPLPDEVSDQEAALVEPLAVGLHAVGRGGLHPGDRVLVTGFGPVGAAVLLSAQAAGASDIYVSEPNPRRRALAESMGATVAIDPEQVDVRREVYARTNRVGPDIVFECTGLPSLVRLAASSVRRGGRVVLVGIGHGAVEIEPIKLVLVEREVVGSLGYRHDLPRVVDLIAKGRIDATQLISETVPLRSAIDEAFGELARQGGDHMKILVDVGAS